MILCRLIIKLTDVISNCEALKLHAHNRLVPPLRIDQDSIADSILDKPHYEYRISLLSSEDEV